MRSRPRWKRLALVGAVVTTLGAWPVAARSDRPSGSGAMNCGSAPTICIQVEYGDSLWTLARQHGDPHRDVRAVVAEIVRVNHVQPGTLQPGQKLVIPGV